MNGKSRISLLKKVPWSTLRLRPYADHLMTPAVATWLGFAWVVILLMASIEGAVWGLVGATMVPRDSTWLAPFSGLFMLVLMFSIIWVVDASLIMSERPQIRARRWSSGAGGGLGALLRWWLGILVRLLIVAVSLYVTAPFLAKLIRADDIAAYHQRQVEQYYQQREQRLQAQIDARTAQLEQGYRTQAEPLEQSIARLTRSLDLARKQRAEIEAEYAPEISVLRKDLTDARRQIGDEILGRDGRRAGRGPEARKWEGRAKLISDELAGKEAELDARVADIDQRIKTLEQSLRSQTETLQTLSEAHQTRVDSIVRQVESEQVQAQPPKLSFAARSKALHALNASPEEAGVPHFETVEGFAQAALGVLFFSLLALKLFEPPAVRAYFSETVQMQYRKYLDGGLSDIPGFELPKDPAQRCNPLEFARLWHAYEKDPAAFFADRKTLVEVREPLTRFLAKQSLEHDRLAGRRANLEHELAFAQRRREHELAAYDRELDLRTAQLQAQLANETRALKDQRRIELATEIQQARAEWRASQAQAEEELRQLREGFEQEQARALETLRLREKEIRGVQAQSLAEVRQAEVARQLAHRQKLAELDVKRQREARKASLAGIREELSRLRALETKQRAERNGLRDASRKLQETLEGINAKAAALESDLETHHAEADRLRQQLDRDDAQTEGTAAPRRIGFWPRADKVAESKTARDVQRDLRAAEKLERAAAEQLAKLSEELNTLQLRKDLADSDLAEAESRVADTATRIQLYEDSLSTLLSTDEDSDREGSTKVGASSTPVGPSPSPAPH